MAHSSLVRVPATAARDSRLVVWQPVAAWRLLSSAWQLDRLYGRQSIDSQPPIPSVNEKPMHSTGLKFHTDISFTVARIFHSILILILCFQSSTCRSAAPSVPVTTRFRQGAGHRERINTCFFFLTLPQWVYASFKMEIRCATIPRAIVYPSPHLEQLWICSPAGSPNSARGFNSWQGRQGTQCTSLWREAAARKSKSAAGNREYVIYDSGQC